MLKHNNGSQHIAVASSLPRKLPFLKGRASLRVFVKLGLQYESESDGGVVHT